MSSKVFVSTAFMLFFVTSIIAQPRKVVADKIIAVVGDKIILHSDIKNSIDDARRQGSDVPEGAECMLMEQAVVSKIMMLQAIKDSLPVTDDDVENELDAKVRMYIRQFGSQQELENVAQKTIYQIKDDARDAVREKLLTEAMQRKILGNVKITPNEVKAFFDKIPKDSLPFFESELEIGQISVFPKASRDLDEYILGEMNSYRNQVVNKKATFEELAKRFSEDPGSKERGGMYQINRNEKDWDPIFLTTAFRLKDGEVSQPVKGKFGYHIIQMVQKNGDDAIVRHILRTPPVTDDEVKGAITKLDSVRSKIVAGTLTFNEASVKYNDDETAKFMGPFLTNGANSTYVTIDQLDPEMLNIVKNLKVGEITQPTAYSSQQGAQSKKGARIVYLKTRTEPHRMNVKDDYSKISQMALEEKKSLTLNKWIKGKVKDYYVTIDNLTSSDCPRLKMFIEEEQAKKGF